MFEKTLIPFALFFGLALGASAQTVVPAGAYTDLGAGPAQIVNLSPFGVSVCVAASQPAPGQLCQPISPGAAPTPFATSLHLWAAPIGNFQASVLVGALSGTAVSQAGSTGLDYSANRPARPVIGANFAASGPYASYVLTAMAPASAARSAIDVENSSGADIVVIRDDGTAATGAAPINASVVPLGGGSAAGKQGGSWTSQTFKGRVSVYAPASLSTAITFTAALTAATAATLSAAWTGASGSFFVTFSDGSVHLATLTNGSTAITWTGAVTGTTAASVATAQVAVFVD